MPLNSARRGAACGNVSSGNECNAVLRFLGYLQSQKAVQVRGLVQIFASPRLAPVVQQYVEHMMKEHGIKYCTVAKYVLAITSVARFTHEMVKKGGSSNASKLDAAQIDQLASLHRQCAAEAAKEDAFHATSMETPVNWLDWKECQLARVHAEAQCAGNEPTLDALHDACLLTLLTFLPPDRVKVYRTLLFGSSLCPTGDGGYKIDIKTPTAHKTAPVFGATRTTLPRAVSKRIKAYATAAKLSNGMYLFYAGTDASQPLEPYAWTRLVKSCFKRHSHRNVPLAPKELRASFVTFLKSGEHSDATLKAAATAMRHSSKTQASNSYNKGGHDKTIVSAMRVCTSYAARFSAAA